MPMIEILLVEDDPVLGRVLSVNLEMEGYKTHWVTDLKSAALARRNKKVDLVLLDAGLPDGSGFQFLRDLRKEDSRLPILMLTAKTDEDSVVEGLQSGANDYLRKPFGDRELLARIKTALREPQTRSHQARYGDLVAMIDKRQVLFEGREVNCSPREFDILVYFMTRAETVVTRQALLAEIDKDGTLFDRTIDSNISHLRARLKKAGIESIQISSIYGVGYRLEKA